MYKSRVYIWIAILIIFGIGRWISSIDFSKIIKERPTMTINADTNITVKSVLLESKFDNFKTIQTSDDAAIIIKDFSNETLDGYDKIEKAIHSPMVLYIPYKDEKPSNIFYSLGDNAKFVDFKEIANAIIEGKTLGDLNIDTGRYKNKKIILNIPSENCFYYNEMIEQIYICLNDYKIPTEEQRNTLKPIVDKLLNKAIICNDMLEKIEHYQTSDEYSIFIAPEFYLHEGSSHFGTSSNEYYESIYFEKSIALGYDIFAKSDFVLNEISLKEYIDKNILKDRDFSNDSCFRTLTNHDYNYLFCCNNANYLDIVYFEK